MGVTGDESTYDEVARIHQAIRACSRTSGRGVRVSGPVTYTVSEMKSAYSYEHEAFEFASPQKVISMQGPVSQ